MSDSPTWLQPLAVALAVAAALELPYLLLRRQFPRLTDRLRYQLWVIAVGLVALLVWGRGTAIFPFGLDGAILAGAGFAAVALTVDLAYRFVDRFVLERRFDARGRHLIPQLVRDLGAWLAAIAGIVLAGHWFLELDLKAFLLPSAVVSAILGFALQDVLKNVFAGIALQTEEPFAIGDWIVMDGEPRQVLEMSWRSTQLRNNLGVEFREPNANLVSTRITNLGSGDRVTGFAVTVGASFTAPPRLVKDTLERAAGSAPGVAATPPPQALVARFAESAVEYELRYWSREVDGAARLRDGVLSRVWYQLHRDGWSIPYPVRAVQLEPAERIAADRLAWRTGRAESLLARNDLFSPLAPEARRRLAESARLLYFDAGERLVAEGNSGDSLMIVSRGAVIVTKAGGDLGTTAVTLATLREGASFGEMSLLTGAPRSASVTADGAVEAFELDRAALAPLLEQDPALAETLSAVLAERVAATAARIEDKREALRRADLGDRQSLVRRIRTFFKLGGRAEA